MATMRARNVSRDTPLADHLEVADGLWARFMGLMGRPALDAGAGLWLHGTNGIHMMFMRFAIDAVFFDEQLRVTKVGHRVRPWIGLAFGGRGAKGVLELPAGAAANVERGDQLLFTDS